ncbi:hypothetical protein [Clostridium sp.]|jgi:hypothetical protein|uniref:hypothetical protein n=1 Tax=Clostridium sp. TaxID=1506 RepID=UPI003EEFB16C
MSQSKNLVETSFAMNILTHTTQGTEYNVFINLKPRAYCEGKEYNREKWNSIEIDGQFKGNRNR